MYFEDFEVRQTFTTASRTVTESDILNFAGVSGDFYSLHTDTEFAKESMFGSRIAHGLLIVSIVQGLWMRLGIFEGTILALYGLDKLRFTKPVFIGDTITAHLTVVEKGLQNEQGLLRIKNEIHNQKQELVSVYDALLLVARRSQ